MARSDVDSRLIRVDQLVADLENVAPIDRLGTSQIRADFAGLLAVAVAASYEACVKETLVIYASSHHAMFGQFTSNNYDRLNSKISIEDLHRYAKLFDPAINVRLKDVLKSRQEHILARTRVDIVTSYKNLLQWRHAFAHAWQVSTTIEEVVKAHRFGKRVIYAFDEAFGA